MPERDDRALYEKLVLDGFQAGLSWITILRKREAFRAAFDRFDPEKIARYDRAKIDALMQNSGIIRNRAKIEGTVTSARAWLKIQEDEGFSNYLWGFFDGRTIKNHYRDVSEIPAQTPLSMKIAKDLKGKGFKFCGPTVVYAFCQATGMVNDHLVTLLAPCRMRVAMSEARAWVRLPSGKRLDLLNPTPFDWEDQGPGLGPCPDLPLGRPLRVALAAAGGAALASGSGLAPAPLSKAPRMPGWSCANCSMTPTKVCSVSIAFPSVKPFLGEAFRTLTARLENAVAIRYGLPPWTPAERAAHKRADRVAAASEAVHVVGWTQDEVRNTLRIPYTALADDPLRDVYGGKAWEPWAPKLAAERFLAELERLMSARNTA